MNHPLITFYKRHEKHIFLFFTIILGIFLLHQVSDYQIFLSQGDHGRDLYCFQKTLEGQKPYQDYWWVYGPAMPYYYSFFYKIFGISIKSVILGKHFLVILSAVFFYLTLCLFASPILAFLGTGWFYLFHPDFFYTYNHIGGIAVIFLLAYLISLYLKDQKVRYLYLMSVCFFLLYVIKINFGVFALICSSLAVLLIDLSNRNRLFTKRKISVLILSFLITPLITFLIYYFLLHKMPLYAIRQCLPYLTKDHPYNSSLYSSLRAIILAIKGNMTESIPNFMLAALINLSLAQTIIMLCKKNTPNLAVNLNKWIGKKEIILTYIIFCIFYLSFLHEYFASGVLYRYFWAKPFVLLLMFITLSFGASNLPKKLRGLLYTALALIIILQISDTQSGLKDIKVKTQLINIPKAQIYVSNPSSWIKTVEITTQILKNNLKKEETFFALPYDPLYYFLTNKTSPTRQLIFFEHINIPKEQELKIINELETKKVNWIVVSSRSNAKEPGLGRFGVTYCPLLGAYIQKNFTVEATIGDWVNEPLWAQNHGTKILRRKKKN